MERDNLIDAALEQSFRERRLRAQTRFLFTDELACGF
jgi:hypothetical protein